MHINSAAMGTSEGVKVGGHGVPEVDVGLEVVLVHDVLEDQPEVLLLPALCAAAAPGSNTKDKSGSKEQSLFMMSLKINRKSCFTSSMCSWQLKMSTIDFSTKSIPAQRSSCKQLRCLVDQLYVLLARQDSNAACVSPVSNAHRSVPPSRAALRWAFHSTSVHANSKRFPLGKYCAQRMPQQPPTCICLPLTAPVTGMSAGSLGRPVKSEFDPGAVGVSTVCRWARAGCCDRRHSCCRRCCCCHKLLLLKGALLSTFCIDEFLIWIHLRFEDQLNRAAMRPLIMALQMSRCGAPLDVNKFGYCLNLQPAALICIEIIRLEAQIEGVAMGISCSAPLCCILAGGCLGR